MKIALTDTHGSEDKFRNYVEWISGGPGSPGCSVLSYLRNNANELDDCEGLVLSGGHDVDPAHYGGSRNHPKIVEVDPRRDAFERMVLEHALTVNMPVLGICRGL